MKVDKPPVSTPPTTATTAATGKPAKTASPRTQLPNGAVLPTSSSSPITGTSRASADVAYDQLPADLKDVMAKSFDWPSAKWNELPKASRRHLVAVYNRMQDRGLWKHVDRITKIVNPERPALGMRVRGNAGSVEFQAKPGTKLLTSAMGTGKFGKDPWYLALMHPGQTSLREVSSGDGLHISIGKNGAFDAHMDKFSPTVQPDEKGGTRIDMRRSGKHWQKEVLPEMIRNYTKIPGVDLKVGPEANKPLPHPDPTHAGPGMGFPRMIGSATVVLQTKEKEQKPLGPNRPTPGTRDVDARMLERVVKSVSSFRADALAAPSSTDKDAMAPADFATSLASRFAYAAKHGEPSIAVDFKDQYRNASPADRRAIERSARDIAAAVAAEMARDDPAFGRIGVRVVFGP